MKRSLTYLFLLLLMAAVACTETAVSEQSSSAPEANSAVTPIAATQALENTLSPADTPSQANVIPSVPTVEVPQISVDNSETTITTLPTETATLETAPSPTPVATIPTLPLPAEWYIDSDGNVIPDFLEVELGYDPLLDDCAPSMCSMETAAGASLLTQEQNVLIILDSSGSMAEAAGNQTRMEAAKAVILDYVAVTSDVVNFGLMALGHQGDGTDAGKPASCAGVELLFPLGTVGPEEFAPILAQLQPNGWTPLGAALLAAEEAFNGRIGDANKVILVTDGLETCGGDPVAAAMQLHTNTDIAITVDVVGFGVQVPEEVAQLQQIAEAGGGIYYDAKTAEDFREYFRRSADEVFERFNFGLCIVENGLTYSVCTNQMVVKATTRIQTTQLQTDPNDSAFAAYNSLTDEMKAAIEESDLRYETFKSQLEALLLQFAEMEQRRNELFGDE